MRTLLGMTAAIATCICLAACGPQQSKTVTHGDGSKTTVTTTADGNATTIQGTGPDGESKMVMGAGAQWPADAPAVFQAYPGGIVTTSMTGATGGENSTMVTFTTKDPVEKVMAFYKGKLEAAGLETQSMTEADGMKMFGGKTKDGITFNIMTMSQEGETTVSVSFGKVND